MNTRKNAAISSLVMAGALVLAACGAGGDADPAPGAAEEDQTEDAAGDAPTSEETEEAVEYEPASVTYLTSFSTFGRDAYAYVAQEKGFFEEVNLDVTIEPGTGSVDVMKLIAGGQAEFGAADFSATVVTVANEQLPVTTVGVTHQRSLAAIVSLDGYGISEPTDLEGKKIGDQPGSTNQVIFPTYAEAAGIDAGAVEFVPSAPPSLPQLLVSNQVDAIGQFVVGEPLIAAAAQGKGVVVLPYGDVLPDLYGNVILTSDELAESDPELVERFIGALMKGLEYSIENPEETGEILQKAQPTQNADVAAAEVEIMAEYVRGDAETIGSIEPERVEKIIEIMADALTGDVTPEDLVSFDLVPGS
ncbi:ABC transporter substrate-binding protein [Actinotalea sp. Marseille-Q4924]|uniref:ABC transporter substrate-binding protein n=1 Tax=Actinotalea sp. Marseille-Q4924 TaxID=2866571 RepID=UPI001CE47DA3|nr:ABC transporter substrate-binding protein [Actinotalea sp. Marseille-Q4924]